MLNIPVMSVWGIITLTSPVAARLNDYGTCFPVAVLPKRETSRRRAKETAKRTTQVLNVGDDEEDIQDIDLEDSDDDATWTPFKVGVDISAWSFMF